MDSEQLRSLQASLKNRYKENPEKAFIALSAEGKLGKELPVMLKPAER